jgi:maltose-binding protein MalE
MDKTTAIRNRLLAEIGSVPAGARIVSARKLAPEFRVSFQFVQRVVDDLADRGVVSVLPRSGMTAHPQWRNRILNGVFRIFDSGLQQDEFRTLCAEKMPEIFISDKFYSSNLELRVTHDLLSHHSSYRDLTFLLKKVKPELDALAENIISAGRFGDSLCGVPVCFSPRVVALNKRVFDKCGCPLPPENWTWSDLSDTISRLEKRIEVFRTFGTYSALSEWMSFVVVNGGAIYDNSDSSDPVKLDSARTLAGLEFFYDLYNRVRIPAGFANYNHTDDFCAGNIAMYQMVRQGLSGVFNSGVLKKEDIELRVLPVPEAGMAPRSMLAAEFFCVRKGTPDLRQAEKLLALLLSPECQRLFARVHSGIPVSEEVLRDCFDSKDPHDAVFASALPHAVLHYNIPDPASYALICNAVARAFDKPNKEFAGEIRRIADALRLLKEFNV